MALDLTLARGQFPALSSSWIFMDNAGGTQVPLLVADAMRDYLIQTNVQHGASYEVSRKAMAATAAGRQFAADLLNCQADEIVFGSSASALLRNLALCLSTDWTEGDEIIISQAEHEANAGCWEYLEQFGVTVRVWEIDPESLTFDLSKLTDMLSDKTKMVPLTHSSNVLGNIMPVKQVVNFARSVGAMVCVDGVGHVPHRLVDVQELGVDFYVCSAYKVFGPHLGIMYGKADRLKAASKWNHFFFEDDEIPAKFELGAYNYEAAAGFAGLEKYFRAMGKSFGGPARNAVSSVFKDIQTYETGLTRDFLNYLAGKPRVHVVGDGDPRSAEERVPIISFLVDGADPEELVLEVDKKNIGIRWGHFYAVRLLQALDMLQYKGVVRVSLAHYNTEAEMARLRDVLDPLIS